MATALAPGSRHAIPIRDPGLDFDASIPRHWLAGSAPATHLFNGMNLVFPDGERFFIRAVRDSPAGVRDPELLRQVKGFVGQEGRQAHALRRRDGGRFPRRLGAGIRAYLRRDFHPNQVDDLQQARRRLAELGPAPVGA